MNISIIFITLEGITIIVLLLAMFNQNRKIKFFKEQYSSELKGVGGSDLFENITKSKVLYKDLLIELHPDRYVGDKDLLKKSNETTAKISKFKSSYRDLIEIAKSSIADFEFTDKFKVKHPEIFE